MRLTAGVVGLLIGILLLLWELYGIRKNTKTRDTVTEYVRWFWRYTWGRPFVAVCLFLLSVHFLFRWP